MFLQLELRRYYVTDSQIILNNENIDELVLDLRGNTGGGFQFALNIGGMFMDHKVISYDIQFGGN